MKSLKYTNFNRKQITKEEFYNAISTIDDGVMSVGSISTISGGSHPNIKEMLSYVRIHNGVVDAISMEKYCIPKKFCSIKDRVEANNRESVVFEYDSEYPKRYQPIDKIVGEYINGNDHVIITFRDNATKTLYHYYYIGFDVYSTSRLIIDIEKSIIYNEHLDARFTSTSHDLNDYIRSVKNGSLGITTIKHNGDCPDIKVFDIINGSITLGDNSLSLYDFIAGDIERYHGKIDVGYITIDDKDAKTYAKIQF